LSGRGRKSNTKIKITLAEQPLQRLESEFWQILDPHSNVVKHLEKIRDDKPTRLSLPAW
jgi:hypothetical protein